MADPDVAVVGSGPNGLAAAVTLARAGLAVTVYEAADSIGGGTRTEELTLPGHLHDVCSAVHPMALASPFFTDFGLADRVRFLTPEVSYAHPLEKGRAALAWRDLDRTVEGLGRDGLSWRSLLGPLVNRSRAVAEFTGGALVRVPRHPLALALFGLAALDQGGPAWNLRWREEAAPALLTGVMSHAILPMPSLGAAAAGLALAVQGHVGGWPIPVGGSRAITDALAADLLASGGWIETGRRIRGLAELPRVRAVLFDTSARELERIVGPRLPDAYRRRLGRFRYGNAVAKVDFALSGPVPWSDPDIARSATVHVGGSRSEIAYAEREVASGRHPARPYVLVSQPTLFDRTRAPKGAGVLWAYTHVPNGSRVDMRETVIRQIERFAPGFRDVITAVHSSTAEDVAAYDPNYIGGDIASGAGSFRQLVARPVVSPDPWRTPAPGIYLCSSSTAPGPGVHGQAGWHAARSALLHEFGIRRAPDLSPKEGQTWHRT